MWAVVKFASSTNILILIRNDQILSHTNVSHTKKNLTTRCKIQYILFISTITHSYFHRSKLPLCWVRWHCLGVCISAGKLLILSFVYLFIWLIQPWQHPYRCTSKVVVFLTLSQRRYFIIRGILVHELLKENYAQEWVSAAILSTLFQRSVGLRELRMWLDRFYVKAVGNRQVSNKNCTKRLYSGTCIKGHRIKRSLCIEWSVVKVPKVVVTLLLNPTGLFVLSSTCIERSVKAEPLKYNRKKILSTFINPCLSLEISVFERVFVRSPWWALVLVHKLTAWNGVFNRFITPPYRGTCTRQ